MTWVGVFLERVRSDGGKVMTNLKRSGTSFPSVIQGAGLVWCAAIPHPPTPTTPESCEETGFVGGSE